MRFGLVITSCALWLSGTIPSASAMFYIGGANGGTANMDSSAQPNRFPRVATTNHSQKEWGAPSHVSVDDTKALQSWLWGNQPHIAVAGTSITNGKRRLGH